MKRYKILLIVLFTAWSSISVEILLTRLFSAIYFSSFTFFIISISLFGIGLSGVRFALSDDRQIRTEDLIFLLAISLPAVVFAVVNIKIDFIRIFDSIPNLIYLTLNFLFLIIPFFLSGTIIIRTFADHSSQISELYFFDLAGAALGAILIIPLIPSLGVIKFFIAISILLILILLLIGSSSGIAKFMQIIAVPILTAVFLLSDSFFLITPKVKKRDFIKDQKRGRIEYSSWSAINKIDIAPFTFNSNRKVIWLNCGTQQSWLVKRDKNIQVSQPVKWTQASIPFQLTEKNSAFIIGSAGGFEVYCALSNGFKKIVAVEMDPELCDLVKNRYSDFIGDIFHRRGVYLINDEGRTVLNGLDKKFDVIQMVNSHPKDTLLSGGFSISETYIYTTRAFGDYWDHLNSDGFLYIVHIYGERMFSTALHSLREKGIASPEKKFFIIQAPKGFNYFFMKKGDINNKDIEVLSRFAGKREITFSPDRSKDNIYYRLAFGDFKKTVKDSSINISPAKDSSPYLNQPNRIGQFKFGNNYIKGVAKEKVYSVLKYTNYVYISILLITTVFSFFLIYLPLKKAGGTIGKRIVPYFFLIGTGYISVEIILIKIFQLLLGNPAYSISMILFSLLLFSGLGSFFSDKILKIFKSNILNISIVVSSILILYSILLFPLIYRLIKLPLFLRILITVFLTTIVGTPLGVFFPFGIKKIGDKEKRFIGWAWGANGFATVLGSVLTVIISINFNFSLVLLISSFIYFSAGLIFLRSQ